MCSAVSGRGADRDGRDILFRVNRLGQSVRWFDKLTTDGVPHHERGFSPSSLWLGAAVAFALFAEFFSFEAPFFNSIRGVVLLEFPVLISPGFLRRFQGC